MSPFLNQTTQPPIPEITEGNTSVHFDSLYDATLLNPSDAGPLVLDMPEDGEIPEDEFPVLNWAIESSPELGDTIETLLSDLRPIDQFYIAKPSSCCQRVNGNGIDYEILNGEGEPSFTFRRDVEKIGSFWNRHLLYNYSLKNSSDTLLATTYTEEGVHFCVLIEGFLAGLITIEPKCRFNVVKYRNISTLFVPTFHPCTRDLRGYNIVDELNPEGLIGEVKNVWPLHENYFGFNVPTDMDSITKVLFVITSGMIYDLHMKKGWFGRSHYWTWRKFLPFIIYMNIFVTVLRLVWMLAITYV